MIAQIIFDTVIGFVVLIPYAKLAFDKLAPKVVKVDLVAAEQTVLTTVVKAAPVVENVVSKLERASKL